MNQNRHLDPIQWDLTPRRTHVLAFNAAGALERDPARAGALLTVVFMASTQRKRRTLALLAETPRLQEPLTTRAVHAMLAQARREIGAQVTRDWTTYLINRSGLVCGVPKAGTVKPLAGDRQPLGTVEGLVDTDPAGALLWLAHASAIDSYCVAPQLSSYPHLGPVCQPMPGLGATIVHGSDCLPATVYWADDDIVGVKRDILMGWARVSPWAAPLPVPQPQPLAPTEWFTKDADSGCWLGKDAAVHLVIGARNHLT